MPTKPAHSSPVPARDSHIGGEQLLAAGVIRMALADAVSADRIVRARYQVDAIAFLRGDDGALDWWIAALGCDERQVRTLIASSLSSPSPPPVPSQPSRRP